MKFTWLSNSPWTPSGYGQQTRIFVPRMAALGHTIGIICYYGLEGGILQIGERITCLPKRFHPYGNDIAGPHTMASQSDFMLTLMDVWVMNPEEYPQQFRWIPWYPVDHDPMPQLVRNKLSQATMRITFSQFGVRMTQDAGLDCMYVPHGIETQTLRPRDKAEARAKIGLPNDRYIVGIVAMNKGNPSRKNFVEMITAFANVQRKHPDMYLHLQTARGDDMQDVINLPELCRNLGMIEGQHYGFCNQYQNIVGFPPEYFADLYSSFNVHMLVSAGEGFGIPTLEAQACGCPVIVGDWTAHSELCLAGRMVSREDAEPFYTGLASYQFRPHIRAVEAVLEEEYRFPTDTTKAVELVRAVYDADVVMQTGWIPALKRIEEELCSRRA